MTNPPSPAALAALTKLLKEAYYSKGTREAHLDAEWLMVQPEWATVVSASSAIPSPTPDPPIECSCGGIHDPNATCSAYAPTGAAPPEGPWEIAEGLGAMSTITNRETGDRVYADFDQASAVAVRDALNRVASRVATGKGEA